MSFKPSGYKSALVSIAGLALPLIFFVAATPYAIASFGEERFGLLLFLLSLQALALSIDFGLSAGGVVLIAKHVARGDHTAASKAFSEIFLFFIILGVLFLLIVYSLTDYFSMGLLFGHEAVYVIGLVRVMMLGVFIALLNNALSLFMRALEQIPVLVMVQNVYNTGIWAAVMFVALSGGDLIDIIWIGVGLYGLQLILYVIWLSRCHEFTFQPVWPQGKHLRETASYSGFAFVSQVTSMVTYHVDRILLGILASVSQVAYYAIPANIVSRLLNVGALFNSFVFPRAVTLHAVGDLVALRALYVKASRYTFLLLVPVLVPLLLFTPELLTLWLGETFSESAQLTTRILLVAFFVATVSITPSQLYNGMGNSRIGAIYATIGSLINVTLCLILIPIFGAAGAAFASLAAMMQAFFYRRALENELAIGRREQRILHFAISFTALIQVGFCLLIHGFNLISDIYSASFALTSAWLLFYLLWLLLPPRFSSQERVLCGKLLIRIGL